MTAATNDYALASRVIQLPGYRKKNIAAVVFHNAKHYQSEGARQQVAQVLQQIDNAITLQKEGKASEEDVRALIAWLDNTVSILRGLKTREEEQQKIWQLLPEMYEHFGQHGERQQTL